MSSDLSQFQESFFEESAEHLSTIEDGLLQLEQHPEDLPELLEYWNFLRWRRTTVSR